MESLAVESQSDGSPIPSVRPGWRWWAILMGVVVLAGLLRVFASTTELWLDELWSLLTVTAFKSPWQVFTAFHHDNNHALLSLWMWVAGPEQAWWVYRVPSIFCGTGAVLLAAWIGRRQSPATGLWAAALIGLSYLMVFYSSEARGYAIACCMTLLAYLLLGLCLRRFNWPAVVAYWFAVVLGMLASLTFASILFGLVIWSAVGLLWSRRGRQGVLHFASLHVVPMVLLLTWWWIDLRHMAIGGGPVVGFWAALCETIGYVIGVANRRLVGAAALPLVLAFVGWKLWSMKRQQDRRWVFFLGALVLGPAMVLLITGRSLLFPRYFLVNVCVLYLLLALHCGGLWDARKLRWVLAAALVAWGGLNLQQCHALLQNGRGHYREALQYIVSNTSQPPAQVGSLTDERTRLLGGYYRRYLADPRQLTFVLSSGIVQLRPEWLLFHASPYGTGLPPAIAIGPDLRYVLVEHFDSTRLSGFQAGIYRRSDLAAGNQP